MEQTPLRIFISSPSDVNAERCTAAQVVERLAREYAYHFRIEAVLWEREPLIATEHFQTMIMPPSATDIVVVVLWSRLGSPLPQAEFLGPISGRQVTGTEWEFENAVKGYQEKKKPDLMFYRKTASISADLGDKAALLQRIHQKELVEEFMRRWFVDEEAKEFKAAFHPFLTTAEFEIMLEQHLKGLLNNRLREAGRTEQETEGISWHQGSPFRGLESFELQHAPIFCGRTRARHELREALKRRAAQGCAFVLALGASGSGKSSLVKAGLLPDLLVPGMMERVALCRYVVVKPSDVAGDLVGGLAQRLLQVQALPEMQELEWDAVSLAVQLRLEGEQAMKPIRQGLGAAGKAAQLKGHAEARLLVIVDQFEELFTHGAISEASRVEFVTVLERLSKSGVVWVVCAMRSDFTHKLESMHLLMYLAQGEAKYHLNAPEAHEFGEIVRRPARMAGLRFEKDGEKGVSLDEVIVGTAMKDPGVLPLLQFLLEKLWESRTAEGLLTFAAYKRLGGLEGALGNKAEEVFKNDLGKAEQEAFRGVLRLLVTVGQGERGAATARTVALSQFADGMPARRAVEVLLSAHVRLLVADGDGAGARVRIVHEALLSHWPRAKQQIGQDYQDLQLRSRLEQAAARWRVVGKKKQKDLLLPGGFQLQEGSGLLKRWASWELEAGIADYVRASMVAHRWRRGKQALAGFLLVLMLPAGYGVVWGVRTYLGVQAVEKEMAFASIPGGRYQMGSPQTEIDRQADEKQHEVCVDKFDLGKFEVTQWEWNQVMHGNPSIFKGDKRPVEMVSWHDAMDFAKYMNWFGKRRYRLPTEAEWEYAARGGKPCARYWGDGEEDACQYANVLDLDAKAAYGKQVGSWFDCPDGYVQTAPVDDGKRKPNDCGLYDMMGNVWEWTCSAYTEEYDGSEKTCAKVEDSGSYRVIRGGSWFNGPAIVRSAYRYRNVPGNRYFNLGLRLARTSP